MDSFQSIAPNLTPSRQDTSSTQDSGRIPQYTTCQNTDSGSTQTSSSHSHLEKSQDRIGTQGIGISSSYPSPRNDVENISSGTATHTPVSAPSANARSLEENKGSAPVQVNQTPFIQKLYSMLEDPHMHAVITWGETGDSFLVSPGEEFSQKLCLYFKHTNISSFVRQLSMYGFHKISNIASQDQQRELGNLFTWEFRHLEGLFRRGDFSSLRQIKRRSAKHVQSRQRRTQYYPSSYAARSGSSTGNRSPNRSLRGSQQPHSNGQHALESELEEQVRRQEKDRIEGEGSQQRQHQQPQQQHHHHHHHQHHEHHQTHQQQEVHNHYDQQERQHQSQPAPPQAAPIHQVAYYMAFPPISSTDAGAQLPALRPAVTSGLPGTSGTPNTGALAPPHTTLQMLLPQLSSPHIPSTTHQMLQHPSHSSQAEPTNGGIEDVLTRVVDMQTQLQNQLSLLQDSVSHLNQSSSELDTMISYIRSSLQLQNGGVSTLPDGLSGKTSSRPDFMNPSTSQGSTSSDEKDLLRARSITVTGSALGSRSDSGSGSGFGSGSGSGSGSGGCSGSESSTTDQFEPVHSENDQVMEDAQISTRNLPKREEESDKRMGLSGLLN